jgi:hypothetical protein
VVIPGQPEPTRFIPLPALLPNVPRTLVHATFSGDTTCETFQSEPAVSLFGTCLADPLQDELPTDPASQTCAGAFVPAEKDTYCDTRDSCLYDVDGDGYPAATLEAENVPGVEVDVVFVAMRSWIAMTGMVANDDLILGTVTFDLVIHPFGCRIVPIGGGDIRACNAQELEIVSRVNPSITQTPGQESTFMAVRLPDTVSCAELIERESEIFGR